jgi:hypothetical protein
MPPISSTGGRQADRGRRAIHACHSALTILTTFGRFRLPSRRRSSMTMMPSLEARLRTLLAEIPAHPCPGSQLGQGVLRAGAGLLPSFLASSASVLLRASRAAFPVTSQSLITLGSATSDILCHFVIFRHVAAHGSLKSLLSVGFGFLNPLGRAVMASPFWSVAVLQSVVRGLPDAALA